MTAKKAIESASATGVEIERIKRVRALGVELQQIALNLGLEAEPNLSMKVLAVALKALRCRGRVS